MKTILILCFLIILSFTHCSSGKKHSSDKVLKVSIFTTESYCGGAAPSEELLAELATPKLYANKDIELFSSRDLSTPLTLLKTNEKGELLLPSSYGKKVYLSIYSTLDVRTNDRLSDPVYFSCYKKFLTDNFIEVSLEDFSKPLILNFEISCNPCLPPAP